ncbi:MAG: PP2C family protein-serine/threonine phosphatase, partial [Anaerolineae bacterium]
VAGHGVSASLHMASIQTLLRTLAPVSAAPVEVLRQVQHVYSHNIRFTTFVTVFLGAYDTAGRTLTYCSAGHNPPLLVQALGPDEENTLWLRPTGPAIGLVEDFEYREEAISLQPGDLLVLYTDGVTEAVNANNEEYGPERLAALVRRARTRAASEVIQAVRRELEEFSDGRQLADDTTIVVCRALDTR